MDFAALCRVGFAGVRTARNGPARQHPAMSMAALARTRKAAARASQLVQFETRDLKKTKALPDMLTPR
jgi:hypothetical protein